MGLFADLIGTTKNALRIGDRSAGAKQVIFDAGGVAVGTLQMTPTANRLVVIPDATGTVAYVTDLDSYILKAVMTTAGDIIYASSPNTPARLAVGSSGQLLHGGSVPAYSAVVESDISLSDITTNNATTDKHGFLPQLSNVATQFLNGQGNFATPAGTASAYLEQAFTSQTSVVVSHNFGAHPAVQIIDSSNEVFIPYKIKHDSVNQVTVSFGVSSSGNIICTLGSPQLNNYITVNDDYTTLADDRFVKETASGKTITLLTAVGHSSLTQIIKNASSGDIVMNGTSSQTIDGNLNITLAAQDAVAVFSDGSNWQIW